MRSPSGTASAPPGQKSFGRSTNIRAVIGAGFYRNSGTSVAALQVDKSTGVSMEPEPTIPPNDPTSAPESGNVRDGSKMKRPPAQEGETKKSHFPGERNQPNTR